jgi:hypothetical protein
MPSNSFVTAVLLPIVVFQLLLNHLNVAHGAAFKEGDFCDVDGADYLDYNFTGEYAVAVEGCLLENNTKTNCLCSGDYSDEDNQGLFIWQCNGMAKFGPKVGKTCPDTVPLVKKTGVDADNFSESESSTTVACNSTIHPGGYNDDYACGYSECETGGSYSAICGCIEEKWICLHSECKCGEGGIFWLLMHMEMLELLAL